MAVYSLTGNDSSPFRAEPAQKGFSMIKKPVESGWGGDAVVCADSVGGDREIPFMVQ